MKAIGISSSGREGAYSKRIVNDILMESHVEFEMIHLADLNIKGCLGCLKCARSNRCIQDDEFHTLTDKIIEADALVFGGGNYYGTLNAIGHAFWERTFALRHQGAFPIEGTLGVAVGLDRDKEKREASSFIERMMLSNKMALIASLTVSGHQQCYDCGFGHECKEGNVYSHIGITSAEDAESKRPLEYTCEDQKEARSIGLLLGSILRAKTA
ncbi:MAG: flavodoxin family protein [Bacteroidales bacterium]|nr:flavodoxin family protein [Bacteroidales bacterium]